MREIKRKDEVNNLSQKNDCENSDCLIGLWVQQQIFHKTDKVQKKFCCGENERKKNKLFFKVPLAVNWIKLQNI